MIDNNLPTVAIIGRPNVGKSSLFNRLLGRPSAITNEKSGTTRDRHYEPLEWNGKRFLLVDTGGLADKTEDQLNNFVRDQVDQAIHEADVIVFLVDTLIGLTDADINIGRTLNQVRPKVILAANKTDTGELEDGLYEFLRLGFGEPHPVSAHQGRGTGDMLDLITQRLKDRQPQETEAPVIRMAIIGRPNVGKSTLVNRLTGEERMVTDNKPGTTRDSVDTYLTYQGQRFCIVDTAGMRKRAHINESIELQSTLHTERSIERCNMALVLVDAKMEFEEQDIKIAQLVADKGRGLIIGMNKWDLVEKGTKTFDAAVKEMRHRAPFLSNIPIVAISALSGQRASKVLDLAVEIQARLETNIAPQDLKIFLMEAVDKHPHPSVDGKFITFYSAFQTSTQPFIIEIKTNLPSKIRDSYIRYLEKNLYDRFSLEGVPVKMVFTRKKR